eukprot:CAMPEP_0113316642 /NCGR_PEP_ID=MMETSP0010_2-20120614/11843_1 /TAXON_ID=216773 ORGANISM="Corethron hystrix, Strain 308" /NCGR_SAMPLE_ID=MMETSP0010_2 /ASSEMBLY_ACC=CAM_ASM_000155 /LENGTH=338 /DNA_ID=CAMNT_0000173413 /DNA_START=147 /DNA_END=1163 /DNA_ORIENTATION=+ /assembly_acc=CAM_ASM_000155
MADHHKHLRAFAAVSFLIGIGACMLTNSELSGWAKPVLKSCLDNSDKSSLSHAYIPWLGGFFVCMVTQFFHVVISSPAGSWLVVVTVSVFIPASIFASIESGRVASDGSKKARLWVGHPCVVWLLGQILGFGVVFPGIFVPAYLLGGGILPNIHSSVDPRRIPMAVLLVFPMVFLTVVLCSISVDTFMWTLAAGIAGGPFWPIIFLILFPLKAKGDPLSTSKSAGLAYGFASFISLGLYVWSTFNLLTSYESYEFIFKAIHGETAHPANKFMLLDAVGILAGAVVLVSIRGKILGAGWSDGLLTLALSPFIGPGTAFGVALMRQEFRTATNILEKKKE